jgi:serine/threonine protein kinase
VKIIDVGLACVVQASRGATRANVGTICYSSFEKLNQIPYGGRDDVWAVGCIFSELTTKKTLDERGGQISLYTNKVIEERRSVYKLFLTSKIIQVFQKIFFFKKF